MSGNRDKIVKIGQQAWEQFSALIHSFLSKAKVKTISLSFIPVLSTFAFESFAVKIVDYTKKVQPQVKNLSQAIITPETVKVVLEKLSFSIFDQPLQLFTVVSNLRMFFRANIKREEALVSNSRAVISLDIPQNKKIQIGLKNCTWASKVKILSDMTYILQKPGIIPRTSFQKFSNVDIISFWQALIQKTAIEKENLELIGVYQPVPLHKVKKIQFDSRTGDLHVFFTAEKKKSKLVRVIIGRDKSNREKTLMVVMPL